jgi:drug/metabolite transporter (DMT)-like permease
MQAVWTALFARLTGEEVSRRAWLGMLLALAGVVLVTGVDLSVSVTALVGDLLALVGGVFSAAYVVAGGAVRQVVSTTTYTTVCYGSCSVLLVVACLIGGVPLRGWSGHDWLLLALLTVAAQLLGHSVFNLVLRTVSPVIVSLTILLEVPGGALLAALWLGQVPPTAAIPAIALIVAGIAVVIGARPPERESAVPIE